MNNRRRGLVAFLAGACVGAAGVEAVRALRFPHGPERVTLTSLSPDDAVRVSLTERPHLIDRDFDLRLERPTAKPGRAEVIFTSPDEGAPPGSERIVWSVDGSRFLLLGRHFFVGEKTPRWPPNPEEAAYVMYDLPTGRLWCNSTQQTLYPPFTSEDLKAVRWRDEAPDVLSKEGTGAR